MWNFTILLCDENNYNTLVLHLVTHGLGTTIVLTDVYIEI